MLVHVIEKLKCTTLSVNCWIVHRILEEVISRNRNTKLINFMKEPLKLPFPQKHQLEFSSGDLNC